jgi:hypothetical protein
LGFGGGPLAAFPGNAFLREVDDSFGQMPFLKAPCSRRHWPIADHVDEVVEIGVDGYGKLDSRFFIAQVQVKGAGGLLVHAIHEAATHAVRGGGGHDGADRLGIDEGHAGNLGVRVLGIVLNNAERIDPNVLNADLPCHGNAVLKAARK